MYFIDIHSHLLPNVDDGARDAQTTTRMLRAAGELGITDIVATPHCYTWKTMERCLDAYERNMPLFESSGIRVHMGWEVNYSALRDSEIDIARFCVAGTCFLLLELDNTILMPRWEFVISDLIQRGYNVIIAHPERYIYIARDLGIAMEMRGYGCEFQVDAECLEKYSLINTTNITARKLLKNGMADYVASDAHSPGDYSIMGRTKRRLAAKWPDDGQLIRALSNIRDDRDST